MQGETYRDAIRNYVQKEAKPPDKFSHQPRLYELAKQLMPQSKFDDDVLYAAAWLHDLGVFIGHRPEDPAKLAQWDNVAYALEQAPALLGRMGFPPEKTQRVLEAIRSHLPSAQPSTAEGVMLRDADILEQLGAIGVLRTVSKVGRDTRFVRFSDALNVLRRNLETLPGKLALTRSKELAASRVEIMKTFLAQAEQEANGIPW